MLEKMSGDDEDVSDDGDFEIGNEFDVEPVTTTTEEPNDENKRLFDMLSQYGIIIEPILPMTLHELPFSAHLIQSLLPILKMHITKLLRTFWLYKEPLRK